MSGKKPKRKSVSFHFDSPPGDAADFSQNTSQPEPPSEPEPEPFPKQTNIVRPSIIKKSNVPIISMKGAAPPPRPPPAKPAIRSPPKEYPNHEGNKSEDLTKESSPSAPTPTKGPAPPQRPPKREETQKIPPSEPAEPEEKNDSQTSIRQRSASSADHPRSISKSSRVTNIREMALREGSEEARKATSNQGGKNRKVPIKVDRRAEAVTDMQAFIRAQNIQMVSPGEQLEIVNKFLETDIPVVSAHYYLINAKWWRLWQRYVRDHKDQDSGYTIYRPGEIDNSPLLVPLDEDEEIPEGEEAEIFARLKDNLQKHEYQIIPKSVWKKLYAWYGGKPTIGRKVVLRGFVNQTLHVELYPLHLRVMKVENQELRRFDFSPTTTIKEARRLVASTWGIPLMKCQLFLFNLELTHKDNLSKTLEETGVLDYQVLLMRGEEELRVIGTGRKGFSEFSQGHLLTNEEGEAPARGSVGLHNAGNTGYMNSVLQALSHSVLFNDYILKGDYVKDINDSNPLGTKGEMAHKFKELLDLLWGDKFTVVAPLAFKAAFTKLDPQFSGANEHSPEDFYEYFLNAVHEDLKKVVLHVNVESSRIVDLFQGQRMTKWVCGTCANSNSSLEPFLYLGVPIPTKDDRQIEVVYVPRENVQSYTKYGLRVSKHGTVKDAVDEFKKVCSSAGNVDIFFVYQDREWPFEPEDDLEMVENGEVLWAFEVDSQGKRADRSRVKIAEHPSVGQSKVSPDKPTTLHDCLENLSSREVMKGENSWFCPKCSAAVSATRRTTIDTVPELFTIHLKRFQQMEVFQDKLSIPVDFPLTLDMAQFKGSIYNLYAFTTHLGDAQSGDFATYSKNRSDDKWYEFKDEQVRLVSEAEVLSMENKQNVYMLFYRKAPHPELSATSMSNRLKSMSRTTSSPNFNKYAPPQSNLKVPAPLKFKGLGKEI